MTSEWQQWLNEQRAQSTMSVEKIPFSGIEPPWGMQLDGNYRREPTAFFNVVGAKIQAKREVPSWTQPMLEEVGKGVVVLAETEDSALLTATPEPGNPPEKKYILLRPTIQASSSNLHQLHKGKRPPYAELLDRYEFKMREFFQDGGRYYQKVNEYGLLKVGDKKEINLQPNSRWFTYTEVYDAVRHSEVNGHLLHVLALRGALRD